MISLKWPGVAIVDASDGNVELRHCTTGLAIGSYQVLESLHTTLASIAEI